MTDYRARSMWLDGFPGELDPRPSLTGPMDADVVIVGAGFTGLWTAYYLKKADPHLRVVVLEREIAGFGASGRNGGWCHTTFPGSRELAEKTHGRQAVIDQQRALHQTVYEIDRVVRDEGIDARFHLGGQLDLALTPVQLLRLREAVEYERSWGFGEDDYRALSAAEIRERIKVAGCLGAGYTPHGAAVDPARLARGLADVVEKLGVPIYERTPVTRLEPHVASTPFGDVRADIVVRATEAFTPELPGYERTLVPIYSLMIGTEPLPESFWDEVGWTGREVFGDFRFLIFYAMRTDDDRIAIGGRGAPYHYGSRLSEAVRARPRRPRPPAHAARRALPRHRRRRGHPPLGRGDRGRPRLVHVGRPRPGDRHGVGRRLRRRRGVDHQPRRPHAARPDPGPADRADRPAVGEPPLQAVGARAAALDRGERGARGHGQRRRRGAEDGTPEQAGDLRQADDRRLTLPASPRPRPLVEVLRRDVRVLGHRRVRRRASRAAAARRSSSATGWATRSASASAAWAARSIPARA